MFLYDIILHSMYEKFIEKQHVERMEKNYIP